MFLTLSVAIKKLPIPSLMLNSETEIGIHSTAPCSSDQTVPPQIQQDNVQTWIIHNGNTQKMTLPHKGFMTVKHPAWLWLQLDFKSSFNFACTSKPFEPLDLKLFETQACGWNWIINWNLQRQVIDWGNGYKHIADSIWRQYLSLWRPGLLCPGSCWKAHHRPCCRNSQRPQKEMYMDWKGKSYSGFDWWLWL